MTTKRHAYVRRSDGSNDRAMGSDGVPSREERDAGRGLLSSPLGALDIVGIPYEADSRYGYSFQVTAQLSQKRR